jgi:hypothetical protein
MKFGKMVSMVKKCSFDDQKYEMVVDLLPEVDQKEEKLFNHVLELIKSFSFDQGKNKVLELLMTCGFINDAFNFENAVIMLNQFSHDSGKILTLSIILKKCIINCSYYPSSIINLFSFDVEKLEAIKLMINEECFDEVTLSMMNELVKCFNFSNCAKGALKLLIPLCNISGRKKIEEVEHTDEKKQDNQDLQEWRKLFDANILPANELIELMKLNPLISASCWKPFEEEKKSESSRVLTSSLSSTITLGKDESVISFSTWKILISHLDKNFNKSISTADQVATINFSNFDTGGQVTVEKYHHSNVGISIKSNQIIAGGFLTCIIGKDVTFSPPSEIGKFTLGLMKKMMKPGKLKEDIEIPIFYGNEKVMDVVITHTF